MLVRSQAVRLQDSAADYRGLEGRAVGKDLAAGCRRRRCSLQTSLVVKPVFAGKPKFWAETACAASSITTSSAAAAYTPRSMVFIFVLSIFLEPSTTPIGKPRQTPFIADTHLQQIRKDWPEPKTASEGGGSRLNRGPFSAQASMVSRENHAGRGIQRNCFSGKENSTGANDDQATHDRRSDPAQYSSGSS